MIKHSIGIDPGNSGAIVVLADGEPHEWLNMPHIKVGSTVRINGAQIADFLFPYKGAPTFLELVGVMPKQGISSAFTFGHSAGVIQGIIQGMGNPLTLIRPQQWKKAAGLIGTDKDAARSKAVLLWPNWRVLDSKSKGGALADAALIGRFGDH